MNKIETDKELIFKRRKIKRDRKKKKEKELKDKQWKDFFRSSTKVLKKLKDDLEADKTFFCIDTEEHEFSRKLLEIGISIYKNKEINTFHFIVKENYDLRNEKYVPDHKDDFLFGESEILSLDEIKNRIQELYLGVDFLVGHSVQNDRSLLKKIKTNNFSYVFDTQILQKHLNQTKKEISLINLCKSFDIETECLHNAGNDAYYTFLCLLKIGG